MKNNETKKAFEELKKRLNAKSYYELTNLLQIPSPSMQRYKSGSTSIGLDKLAELSKRVGYQIKIEFIKNK